MFVKADFGYVSVLKQVLMKYERVFGQKVNFQKSEIFGGKNIDEYMIQLFGEFMGMSVVSKHSKYLGLPYVVGMNKYDVFRSFEDKMGRKIQDWKTLLLSSAGKETLIKSYSQCTPIYAMTFYKLPKTLCDKFASMVIKYLWAGNGKERNIHWLSKEVMQLEKEKGGLAFRCFEALNLTFLMKQLWRFLSELDHLVCQICRKKYFKEGDC
ncbi:hypothetical protein QQ045_017280 [Rhodiola kirilowii]